MGSIFQWNQVHKNKKMFNIYEFDLPTDKIHSDFDVWADRDEDRIRQMDERDTYLNIPQLLLYASQKMKELGK